MEQASQSDQESNDLPQLTIIANNVNAWQSAIAGGASRLQSLMVQIGQQIVTNSDFTAAIITGPGVAALTDKSNAKTVLIALGVEMAAAQDNKKINTLTTSGLTNFLNKVAISGVIVPLIPLRGRPTKSSAHTIPFVSPTFPLWIGLHVWG